MILHFDFSIPDLERLDRSLLRDGLVELLRVHRCGYHLLIFNRNVGGWIKGNLDLPASAVAMVDRISSNFTQTADLIRRATDYIRIALFEQSTIQKNGRAVEMSLDQVVAPHVLERSLLLIEDIESDGKLYAFLLQNLKDKLNVPPLKWELMHGGGDRIRAVAKEKLSDRRIIAAIVDSDLRGPSAQRCSKEEGLCRVASENSWPLLFSFVPPCREAENIIPWSILALTPVAVDRRSDLDVCLVVAEAESRVNMPEHESVWLYLDLKEGHRHEKLSKLQAGWLEERLLLANIAAGDFAFVGFGEKIMSQVFASNAILAELRRAIRSDDWMRVFGEFFIRLAWIFAGGRVQYT